MYSPNHSNFVQKISEKIVKRFNQKYPDKKIDLLETYIA
jgi:ABC-type phosphate transport system substrate-binding protein